MELSDILRHRHSSTSLSVQDRLVSSSAQKESMRRKDPIRDLSYNFRNRSIARRARVGNRFAVGGFWVYREGKLRKKKPIHFRFDYAAKKNLQVSLGPLGVKPLT